MAWFRREKTDTQGTQHLQEALTYVLETWRDGAEGVRRERLERLIARVQQLPAPTGLRREIEILFTGEVGEEMSAQSFSEAVQRLVAAMEATALLDDDLVERIQQLARQIPRNELEPKDVRRVARQALDLQEEARPVRQRAVQDRKEMALLLSGLTEELSQADRKSEQLDGQLSDVVFELERSPTPEALRDLRGHLLSRVRTIAQDSAALRRDLQQANTRTSALETIVARQNRVILDLRAKSSLDPLTGLLHRGAFEQALDEFMRRARTMEQPLSLILLDIDHFKQINDTYGHPVGDQVLKDVAACLQMRVRSDDVVARIGGEEFALLLPCSNEYLAEEAAERIRLQIEGLPFVTEGATFSVTISLGVGCLEIGESGPALYKRVDRALYKAKRDGRNQVKLAS